MNAYDHQLLEVTWVAVEEARDQTAARFYEELFARDSSLRLLFLDADLTKSGRALLHGVGVALGQVARLERQVAEGRAAGVVTHGAIRLVGTSNLAAQALLAAIADTLGDAWTPQVADVWFEFCSLLAASQRQIVRATRRAA
jgi:hemoglobin-like flavoprotein